MTDNQQDSGITKPKVKKDPRGPSLVWFVPIVALLLGGWLIYRDLASRGPLITISFESASGIEAGKTTIKYRDVTIGQVETVEIGGDFESVVVSARLSPTVTPYLNESTKFWIERPRITSGGVSGLGTLLAGAYIGFEAIKEGKEQTHFEGLENPPVVNSASDGIRVTLNADTVGSLITGGPIYYKSFKVGTIESVRLDNNFEKVLIDAFIRKPYDTLVHSDSRFWNVSGISADVSAEGLSVNFESIESLLLGGIEFDSPSLGGEYTAASNNDVFNLYARYDDIFVRQYPHKLNYIVNFDHSIRGLNVGAPVEYRGITIGRVADITSEFDLNNNEILLPVLLEIEPERLGIKIESDEDLDIVYAKVVDLGFRAKLEIGNLLTGKLYVTVDQFGDGDPVSLPDFNGHKQLPTVPTALNQITGNIDKITAGIDKALTKINSLEVEPLIDNLNSTLESMRKTLNDTDQFLDDTDSSVESVAASLDKTLKEVRLLLENGNAMFRQGKTLMQGLDEGSATRYDLDQTLQEFTATAQSLRALIETIEKNPNSLIFGKPKPAPE